MGCGTRRCPKGMPCTCKKAVTYTMPVPGTVPPERFTFSPCNNIGDVVTSKQLQSFADTAVIWEALTGVGAGMDWWLDPAFVGNSFPQEYERPTDSPILGGVATAGWNVSTSSLACATNVQIAVRLSYTALNDTDPGDSTLDIFMCAVANNVALPPITITSGVLDTSTGQPLVGAIYPEELGTPAYLEATYNISSLEEFSVLWSSQASGTDHIRLDNLEITIIDGDFAACAEALQTKECNSDAMLQTLAEISAKTVEPEPVEKVTATHSTLAGANANVPVGLGSVTIKAISDDVEIHGYQMDSGEVLTLNATQLPTLSGHLPEIVITGTEWTWIALDVINV